MSIDSSPLDFRDVDIDFGLWCRYAGWMGTVAARYKENGKLSDTLPSLDSSRHRLAAVAGTSTCHIVQSPEGVFVNGVWGPYKVFSKVFLFGGLTC